MSEYDEDSLASWAHQDEFDQQAAAVVQRLFTQFDDMLFDDVPMHAECPAATTQPESLEWKSRWELIIAKSTSLSSK